MFDNFILQLDPLYFGNKYYELYSTFPKVYFISFQPYGSIEMSILWAFVLAVFIKFINKQIELKKVHRVLRLKKTFE
jgi:hypothetical protein